MAKSKKKATSRDLLQLDDASEVEWATLCLTHFVRTVQPSLADGDIYNIVYSLLMDDEFSPEVAEEYGGMLRATLDVPRDENVH